MVGEMFALVEQLGALLNTMIRIDMATEDQQHLFKGLRVLIRLGLRGDCH
jgi:hypothetical protein